MLTLLTEDFASMWKLLTGNLLEFLHLMKEYYKKWFKKQRLIETEISLAWKNFILLHFQALYLFWPV